MTDLRQRIRAEQNRYGFSDQYMAKRFHKDVRTWRRWMSQPEELELWKIECIAGILNTTVTDLVGGQN